MLPSTCSLAPNYSTWCVPDDRRSGEVLGRDPEPSHHHKRTGILHAASSQSARFDKQLINNLNPY